MAVNGSNCIGNLLSYNQTFALRNINRESSVVPAYSGDWFQELNWVITFALSFYGRWILWYDVMLLGDFEYLPADACGKGEGVTPIYRRLRPFCVTVTQHCTLTQICHSSE